MRLKRTARFSSRRLRRFRVVLGDAEQAQGGTDGLAGDISDE